MEIWARGFLLLGLVLLPLMAVPIAGFPFGLTKIALFSALLSFSALFFSVVTFKARAAHLPFSKLSRSVLALLCAYAIATVLSQDWKLSLAGSGNETDTLLFVALCALTFFLCAALFRSRDAVRSMFSILLTGASLAGAFQLFRLVAGGSSIFTSTVFSNSSTNLVGSLNDLGIVVAMVAVLCVSRIDSKHTKGLKRIIFSVILLIALVLLSAVNFSVLWWLLLAAALVVMYAIVRVEIPELGSGAQRFSLAKVPYASAVVVVLSVVFLIWGSTLGAKVQKFIPISEPEAQLTSQTSLEITRSTYAQSALTTFFGSGPNTFAQQWLLYKPANINSSQFWTLDFSSGYSTVLTSFLSVGLIGGIIFIFLPIMLLVFFFRKISHVKEPERREIVIGASALSVLLIGSLCFYVPGPVVLLFAFAVLGVFEAWMASHELTMPVGKGRPVASLILLAAVVVAFVCTGALLQRFMGSYYQGKAITAAGAGNNALSETYGKKALSVYRSEGALHLLATLKFSEAQAIAAEKDKATESTRAARFQAALSEASTYATAATTEYGSHYGNWLTLAQLYEALIPLKVNGAIQQSEAAYTNAIQLSPRNPQIYLMAARMEATANNEQSARSAVGQALTLKPNYTDAILFVVQLEVAKKNVDAAIQAAAAAVQTAPTDPSLWFELGVLAYNKPDDKTAIAALEKAVSLLPDYANAKYFLGLSYYRSGRVGDGVAVFSDLAAKNPDNTEVAGILAAMKAGKPPFPAQAAAPTTAPIKGQ